jgi:ABC-type transport system substrate-binding protein
VRIAAASLVLLVLASGSIASSAGTDASGATGGTLTIGVVAADLTAGRRDALMEGLSNDSLAAIDATGFGDETVSYLIARMLYNGLYRMDSRGIPVPDLADGLCDRSPDRLTVTCRLVEATFSDGSPLTAHDVAFTFDVATSQACPDWGFDCFDPIVQPLERTEVVDDMTVAFHLRRPDSRFDVNLARLLIEPAALVRAQVQAIQAATSTLGQDRIARATDDVRAELDRQAEQTIPDCDGLTDPAEDLVTSAGVTLHLELKPRFVGEDGRLDACLYAELLWSMLASLDALGGMSELNEAAGIVHWLLPIASHPVGTGAWELDDLDRSDHIRLAARADGHHGPPGVAAITVQLLNDYDSAVDELEAGRLDWLTFPVQPLPEVLVARRRASRVPGVVEGRHPLAAYVTLVFNTRPGRLFDDVRLRRAVSLCFDKNATVDAATEGEGFPAWGDVPPPSWTYATDLPQPQLDVGAATALIDAAGWNRGPDDIYQKDGQRLSATVIVNQLFPQRRKYLELMALQLRECGIEILVRPRDFTEIGGSILTWPHIPTGDKEPFDVYFSGYAVAPDGSLDELYHSRELTSDANPEGGNLSGYSDPDLDRVIETGITAAELTERGRAMREAQATVAEAVPGIPAWWGARSVLLRDSVGSRSGPLDLRTWHWDWQLEDLVRVASE